MPTLRDRVRETLAAREPNDRDARADLHALLERSSRKKRRRPIYVLAGCGALAAATAVLVHQSGTPPGRVARVETPVVLPSNGIHLYLRVHGEPEDRALDFELAPKGDRP